MAARNGGREGGMRPLSLWEDGPISLEAYFGVPVRCCEFSSGGPHRPGLDTYY